MPHMNDSQNNRLADLTPPKSPGRKPQFSIGKTLLWTAVVAGGLTVVKVSEPHARIGYGPFEQAISLSFYLVVVCGILSFLRAPKSFDVWFPTGMNVFIPVFLGLVVLVREPSSFSSLVLVVAGDAQLFGAVRRKSRPGSCQKPPGLPRDVAKGKKNR